MSNATTNREAPLALSNHHSSGQDNPPGEPNKPLRVLGWLLRFNGTVLLLACAAVLLPHSLMDDIHQWLGLGQLPNRPIIGYLTRSVSGLYAVHGAVTLFVSFDVHRYRPLIRLIIALNLTLGATLIGIDLTSPMPWWWTLGEGPGIVGFAILLALCDRLASSAKT